MAGATPKVRAIEPFFWTSPAATVLLFSGAGVAMASIDPPMGLSEWTQFVRDVGFPIFVAGYVLIRLERTMTRLADTITSLLKELRDARR